MKGRGFASLLVGVYKLDFIARFSDGLASWIGRGCLCI